MTSAAKVLQRVDLSLRSFYIFNAKFSTADNEEHKILYYHPHDIELNTKVNDVGLSEAIIAFTGSFTADESGCHALHTQKTTQLFYQPEPGYWMVLVINVPKEIRLKDGVEVPDYRGPEVHDRVYRALLEQSYRSFCLFHGTFEMNLRATEQEGREDAAAADDEAARERLQTQLHAFYQKHIPTLRLTHCDIWDVLRSIQYLPLEKLLFLRSHNFVSMIRATFPAIEDVLFLYNDQVVCSGKLDAIDLYGLYECLSSTLLTNFTQSLSLGDTYPKGWVVVDGLNSTASTSSLSDDAGSLPTRVFLRQENAAAGGEKVQLEAYDMIVYRTLNATLCLFVRDRLLLPLEFYSELAAIMGPQLESLARDIGETLLKQQEKRIRQSASATTTLCTSTTASDGGADAGTPKFLFINEQSLKHLSNIALDRRRPKVGGAGHGAIPINVMNLIADLRNEIGEATTDDGAAFSSFEEVQVKTTNDFWIVKRRCNWRQYYVIVCNSKATLLDVTQEAKRIFEQELTDDVFFDK